MSVERTNAEEEVRKLPSNEHGNSGIEDNHHSTTDAGHPRFLRRNRMAVEKCYCSTCDVHFQNTPDARDKHFCEGHVASTKCQYCNKEVYVLLLKDEEKLHHNCIYDVPIMSPSSGAANLPSTSSLDTEVSDSNEGCKAAGDFLRTGNKTNVSSLQDVTLSSDINSNIVLL